MTLSLDSEIGMVVRIMAMIVTGAYCITPRRTLRLVRDSWADEFPGHGFGILHLLSIPVFLYLALQFAMQFN